MSGIKLDDHNYRIHNDKNKRLIKKSLKECGAGRSILMDNDDVIIAGNGVYEQSRELGLKVRIIETDGTELIAIKRKDLSTSDEKRKLLALADNHTSDTSEFDIDAIMEDFNIEDLDAWEFNLDGFDLPKDIIVPDENSIGKLQDKFIVPPFSILDTKQGYWQERKKAWLALGIRSEEGRESEITYNRSSQPPRVYETRNMLREKHGVDPSWDEIFDYCKKHGIPTMDGTSIFDPVLCELVYRWFNVDGGSIIDPFAGGSVRGIVASKLGMKYIGNDLRMEQITANIKNAVDVLGIGAESVNFPRWTCRDSVDIDKIVPDHYVDMIFSCPPYADLEVYSDDPKDLSNMDYEDFLSAYRTIIRKSCGMLKENRFAVFVVGDVRDKQGLYRNFVSETISAFLDSGLHLYNEMILVNIVGSLAMRVGKQFNNSRKIGKQHQNVLVFYKGDPKAIKKNYPELDLSELDLFEE